MKLLISLFQVFVKDNSNSKFIAIPVSTYFRRQSLKDCFHDGNKHPMKVRQTCLHHTRALKATR